MARMTALPPFDTIILLTGSIEAAALAGVLGIRDPSIDIRYVETLTELEAFDVATLARARLIAFSTDVIVPQAILEAIGYGAYNFHPGPPNYPGWGPGHFAIYEQAGVFGVTVHMMHRQVDTGPIVGVELFVIPNGTSVARLDQLAFAALARVFWNLAPSLTRAAPLEVLPVSWSGRKSTRRRHQEMRELPITVSKDDLDRRIDAFGKDEGGDGLFVTLHGHRFRYVAPAVDLATPTADNIAPEYVARRA
jgi:methionyl-tRNA formyltransferase